MNMKNDDKLPVSDTDGLTIEKGRPATTPRSLGDFRPTNAPLSEAEIEDRKKAEAELEKHALRTIKTVNVSRK